MAKNIRQPEYNLRDLLDLVKKELMLSLNCHGLATIQSFDAETQTVTAQLLYKQAYEQRDARSGKYSTVLVDYPLLVDCPVIIFGGGGGSLTFPIAAGDQCLVLFNDRDIDNWFAGAANGDLASSRLHSMADGIALVGLHNKAGALPNYDEERASLQYNGGKVGVGEKLVLRNSAVDFREQLDLLLTGLSTFAAATAAASTAAQIAAAATPLVTVLAAVKVQLDLLFATEEEV